MDENAFDIHIVYSLTVFMKEVNLFNWHDSKNGK